MHRNHFEYQTSSERISPQFSMTRNPLGIGNTNFIWDRTGHQLIIISETNQTIGREINVLLKGNRLILEAPLDSSYDKPYRTHLIERETRNEVEDGLTVIAFSEIKLKPGYHYSLVSSRVMEPNLIKVILGFRPLGRNRNN